MKEISAIFKDGVFTRKEGWIYFLVSYFSISIFIIGILGVLMVLEKDYKVFFEVSVFCEIVICELVIFKRLKDITDNKIVIALLLILGVVFVIIPGTYIFFVIILCIPSAWIKSSYVQQDLDETSLEINQLIEADSYKIAAKKARHIINIYESHFGANSKEVIELRNIFNIKFNNKIRFYIPRER